MGLADSGFTKPQASAERFLLQCEKTTGVTPMQVTTDKEAALYPAMKKVFPEAFHRDVKYKNNNIEADHRGIKSRYKAMKGFKNSFSALRFCTVLEKIRQHFSMRNKTRSERRHLISSKIQHFGEIFIAS